MAQYRQGWGNSRVGHVDVGVEFEELGVDILELTPSCHTEILMILVPLSENYWPWARYSWGELKCISSILYKVFYLYMGSQHEKPCPCQSQVWETPIPQPFWKSRVTQMANPFEKSYGVLDQISVSVRERRNCGALNMLNHRNMAFVFHTQRKKKLQHDIKDQTTWILYSGLPNRSVRMLYFLWLVYWVLTHMRHSASMS